ncbi:hypothetical protein RI054_16g75090 [Pseudoscourfieldia marina]
MELFQNETGERPWFFRAPYGELNQDARQYLGQRRLYTFHWDMDSRDWQMPHNNIKETIRKQLRKGILLMHEHSWTAEQMPQIIATIRNEDYRIASPAKLVAHNLFVQEACPSHVHATACAEGSTRPPPTAPPTLRHVVSLTETLWVPNYILLLAAFLIKTSPANASSVTARFR